MAIKPTWVVECIETGPYVDHNNQSVEFKSERAALRQAKSMVAGGQEQVWVYRLSHVVSRPSTPVQIDRVR